MIQLQNGRGFPTTRSLSFNVLNTQTLLPLCPGNGGSVSRTSFPQRSRFFQCKGSLMMWTGEKSSSTDWIDKKAGFGSLSRILENYKFGQETYSRRRYKERKLQFKSSSSKEIRENWSLDINWTWESVWERTGQFCMLDRAGLIGIAQWSRD